MHGEELITILCTDILSERELGVGNALSLNLDRTVGKRPQTSRKRKRRRIVNEDCLLERKGDVCSS